MENEEVEKLLLEMNAEINGFVQSTMSAAMKTDLGPSGTLYALGVMVKAVVSAGGTTMAKSLGVEQMSDDEAFKLVWKGYRDSTVQVMVVDVPDRKAV